EGLVEREAPADGLLDLALGHLLAIHAERAGAGPAGVLTHAALILEVERDRVLAGRELLIGRNAVLVLLLVGVRVYEDRLAVEYEYPPPAEPPALRRQDTVPAPLGNLHGRGDAVRLVLDVRGAPLGDADHPREVGERGPPASQARADGGIDPLG